VLAARGAVNDQDAWRLVVVLMFALGLLHGLLRGTPVVGQIVVRIGKARSSLVRARRLAVVGIALPAAPAIRSSSALSGSKAGSMYWDRKRLRNSASSS
jgi:hypothetical protein